MKRILFAGTLALATCGQALAADLPPAAAPPRAPAAYVPAVAPTYNWGGFYIGVNGGGAFGTSNWSDPLNPATGATTGDFNMNGWLVGGTVGANFQASQLVFGIEADLDWANIKGDVTNGFCTLANVSSGAVVGATCETKTNYLGTVRGRLGFAADRVLLFATGGLAFANVQAGLTGPAITTPTYDSNNKLGWTAGGGVEVALGDNWTAKVEYLYASLQSGACTSSANCGINGPIVSGVPKGPVANDTVKFATSLVRVGVNYKFGGGQ
jgi:outer membrane immunogenic protein